MTLESWISAGIHDPGVTTRVERFVERMNCILPYGHAFIRTLTRHTGKSFQSDSYRNGNTLTCPLYGDRDENIMMMLCLLSSTNGTGIHSPAMEGADCHALRLSPALFCHCGIYRASKRTEIHDNHLFYTNEILRKLADTQQYGMRAIST